jgi:tRNA-dihydrouridine synthase B
MSQLQSAITLGGLTLRNQVALAPMAGLSDVPFRTLAWQMGAGYMVSEMVGSKPELWESGKSRLRRIPVPGANPVAVQIAGTDPDQMAAAAKRHVDDGVQVIDLNFGCPVKKVCRKAAGSALLADLDLIAAIVDRVAHAVPVPVTVKTRAGLLPGDDLGVQAGVVAQNNGAQMLVMHGRSRACRFKGEADYGPVRRLKESVGIPVLVNGDIDSVTKAHRAMAESGADGVMVGRAALGQPWLFAELTGRNVPSREQKLQLILQHVERMHAFYGARSGVGIVRKHIIAYFERLGLSAYTRAFLQLQTPHEQINDLARLFAADPANTAQEHVKIPRSIKAA